MGKARTAHRVRMEHVRFETARAAQRRHRVAVYWIPAVVVLVVAMVAVFASMGGKNGTTSVKVSVEGPALSAPLSAGDTVPHFRAPGLNGGTVSWARYRGRPSWRCGRRGARTARQRRRCWTGSPGSSPP
jgi:hypothetical protein